MSFWWYLEIRALGWISCGPNWLFLNSWSRFKKHTSQQPLLLCWTYQSLLHSPKWPNIIVSKKTEMWYIPGLWRFLSSANSLLVNKINSHYCKLKWRSTEICVSEEDWTCCKRHVLKKKTAFLHVKEQNFMFIKAMQNNLLMNVINVKYILIIL